MCGRFTHMYSWEEIVAFTTAVVPAIPLAKRYNVAPTQNAPVIRCKLPGEPKVDFLRWGLIPSWSRDEKIGASMINARCETVSSKPSFKAPFRLKRCVIPISGFYEWKKDATTKQKQPFYITSRERKPLFLAGIWDCWSALEAEREPVESFSIITTTANDTMAPLHDRMPVILAKDSIEKWLANSSKEADLQPLLVPCPGGWLSAIAVSTLVNSARNDSEGCVLPL